MVDYSDINPAGTTRTTKRGIARHIPLLPDYFNHQWIEDYVTDFLQKNIMENNGVISGCVISVNGADKISTSSGEVFVNGNRVTVAAPGDFTITADGWYVSYVTSAGTVIHGYLENSTAQGAVTPADSVIIGYTAFGTSAFNLHSFFNEYVEDVEVHSDFSSKNLIINVQSNTTSDADADNIIFVNSVGSGRRVDGINETFDMTVDRPDGAGTTNELASTWYQKWLDSDLNKALVPDITSSADGTTAGFLVDSANEFFTHLVKAGDIVYNLTDLTQTTVSVTPTADNADLALTDDIFVSGDDYKIRMLSPTGLGSFKARIGAVYNNSGSNLDDSTYTQIQEEKFYSEAAGDFTVTGTNSWTSIKNTVSVRQHNDWTGAGLWEVLFHISGTMSNNTDTTITITGVIFLSGFSNSGQSITAAASGVGSYPVHARAENATATIRFFSTTNATSVSISGPLTLLRKPTFHN